jgi:hypothetical protein
MCSIVEGPTDKLLVAPNTRPSIARRGYLIIAAISSTDHGGEPLWSR